MSIDGPDIGSYVGSSEYMNINANFTSNHTKPAVEVHWGISKTYDYFKYVHNRTRYANQGSIIRNYYNFPAFLMEGSTNNAGAIDQEGAVGMIYGSGDNIYMDPVVALDVTGHEFSHLVISRNGLEGLNYVGESGALNESFADIFGTAIEFYTNLFPNWTLWRATNDC